MVFSLTPTAATALIDARSEVGAHNEWGIRFFEPWRVHPASPSTFSLVPSPTISSGGSGELRTYVEAAVHREIGHATVDFDDSDGSAELVIRPLGDLHRGSRSFGTSLA